MKKEMTQAEIKKQMKEIDRRLRSSEAVSVFFYRVQVEQLAKAEELRKAVAAVMKTYRVDQVPGSGSVARVDWRKMNELYFVFTNSPKFHQTPRRKLPELLAKLGVRK